MKEVKFFDRYDGLHFYMKTSGYKLGILLSEFLNSSELPSLVWLHDTYSGSGRGNPCVFFTENVLHDYFSSEQLSSIQYKDAGLYGWVPRGEYIKIGVTYNGHVFDAWLYLSKFNSLHDFERRDIIDKFPQYFSDSRPLRGFFSENLTEEINREFTSNSQIAAIMDSDSISLDQKAYALFDRTAQHIFDFGMCSFRQTDEAKRIARDNGGDLYAVDLSAALDIKVRAHPSISVATLMCLGEAYEAFDIQESWNYYVKGEPCAKYGGRSRSETYKPLDWWKYLKAVVEAFEKAANWEPEPNYKRGFFSGEEGE